MERFVRGDVIVISFPYSDFSDVKKRPAVIISTPRGHNVILSQITTNKRNSEYLSPLTKKDFAKGSLNKDGFINIEQIFTAKESLIAYKVGKLNKQKIKEVEQKLCKIFTR